MTKNKRPKKVDIFFIYPDTAMKLLKCEDGLCLAFDVGKTFLGIGIEDEAVALAMSSYFKQMARAIKKARVRCE